MERIIVDMCDRIVVDMTKKANFQENKKQLLPEIKFEF